MYKYITILVRAETAGRAFAHKQYHGDGHGRTNPDLTNSILTVRQVVHKQPATKVLVVACTRGHAHSYTYIHARASLDKLSNPPYQPPYPCVGADIAMTQPGTPVQAHPGNPAATQPTTSTVGHEQPRPACSQTALPPGSRRTQNSQQWGVSRLICTAPHSICQPQMPTSLTALHIWQPNTATSSRAHPKRAGKPGRATCHASTTHGSTFRVEAERVALADTAGSFISDEQLKRDITHWRKAGTLETVIEDHHARHRENGPNEERATR
jgi:hypothetical protein